MLFITSPVCVLLTTFDCLTETSVILCHCSICIKCAIVHCAYCVLCIVNCKNYFLISLDSPCAWLSCHWPRTPERAWHSSRAGDKTPGATLHWSGRRAARLWSLGEPGAALRHCHHYYGSRADDLKRWKLLPRVSIGIAAVTIFWPCVPEERRDENCSGQQNFRDHSGSGSVSDHIGTIQLTQLYRWGRLNVYDVYTIW